MANFKLIDEPFKGNRDSWIENFEKKVEMYLNDGWKLVNAIKDNNTFFAFMQRD